MSNRRKQTHVPVPVTSYEPYPEHAKMAAYIESNWAIKDFLAFLADRGVFLSRVQSGKIVHVTEAQVEGSLLEARGVDIPAYQAESRKLLAQYGADVPEALAGMPRDPEHETMIRIIGLLDSLGVPAWAGRPVCSTVLREAGYSQPATELFARTVKMRKFLYGVTGSIKKVPNQPQLPLDGPPEPLDEQPSDAASMLRQFMNQSKEEVDVGAG